MNDRLNGTDLAMPGEDRQPGAEHRLAGQRPVLLGQITAGARPAPGCMAKARGYAQLTRLDRPIGIWLLLWPALWALWLASNGRPDPQVFVVFVLGTVLTRSAGCAMNDFADRKFDGHVQRTRDRPLVTGSRSHRGVGAVRGLGLIALGLAMTLNRLSNCSRCSVAC